MRLEAYNRGLKGTGEIHIKMLTEVFYQNFI